MQKFYTTAELAERLKAKPQVIRASRVSGMLFGHAAPKFIRLGARKILYPESEVNKYLAEHELRLTT